MLKFIKGYVSSIDGIEIYPIISFIIFFVFFLAVTYFVITAKKSYIEELSNIPFEDGEDDNISNAINSSDK
jgi:cbb3-type cytochrome oxidase subunit 3